MAKGKDSRLTFKFCKFFVSNLKLEDNKIYFGSNLRINDLVNLLKIPLFEINKKIGTEYTENQLLDDDQLAEIAIAFDYEFEKVDDVSEENVLSKINKLVVENKWEDEGKAEIISKPPIVTIMGHVDHGKTTLLDYIRKSNLVTKEAGGITQTIGAYKINKNGREITFIDTPGHEAFTEMRANGTSVTDIAIIVVAADDSIMPQTKESIDHAKAACVPIIIAINKMDKPGADPEKVKSDLSDYGLMPEEWGGDTTFVEISALKGDNIDKLLDTVLLVEEMMEKKCPKNVYGTGVVVESNIDKQRGNLVSVIVKNGTIKVGDSIVIDDIFVKVKAMRDDQGNNIKEAGPSTPVELFGIGAAPDVGSCFAVISDDKEAKQIAEIIKEAKLNRMRKIQEMTPEEVFQRLANKSKKQYNIILKTDSLGSLEAISAKINQFVSDDVEINIIRKSIGEITNTDVNLAAASNAEIISFNVKTPKLLDTLIKEKMVVISYYDIIYKLLEEMEERISGMEEIKYKYEKIGEAKIQQVFSSSKIGKIAGFVVNDGSLKPQRIAKVMRDGKEIYEGKITSLKTGKDDTRERRKGQEGGLTLEEFEDYQVDDIIECYEKVKA